MAQANAPRSTRFLPDRSGRPSTGTRRWISRATCALIAVGLLRVIIDAPRGSGTSQREDQSNGREVQSSARLLRYRWLLLPRGTLLAALRSSRLGIQMTRSDSPL